MTTLIVSYLPGHPASRTARILERFRKAIPPSQPVIERDLLETPAPLFTRLSARAYARRAFMNEAPDAEEAASLAPMDALVAEARAARTLVLAFPMYNFAMPAAVKAYLDAIMLKGGTWDADPRTGLLGLMAGRRAVVISSAGLAYAGTPIAAWQHLTPLLRTQFGFMGFSQIETILAEGTSMPDARDATVDAAGEQAAAIAAGWYAPPVPLPA